MAKFQRTTMTLPQSVTQDLRYCSAVLGISVSALTAELLAETLSHMSMQLHEALRTERPGSAGEQRRLVGGSIAVIRERLAELERQMP